MTAAGGYWLGRSQAGDRERGGGKARVVETARPLPGIPPTVVQERLDLTHKPSIAEVSVLIARVGRTGVFQFNKTWEVVLNALDAATMPAVLAAVDALAGSPGREALRGMRSVVRTDPDAARAPAPMLDDLPALVDAVRSPVCEVALEERGARLPLPVPAVVAVHRVVQEGLTNAVRHARHPVRIDVVLEWADAELRATVTDDGGAGPADAGLGTGAGLIGLAERVESVGGTLIAAPAGPRGWALAARIPMIVPDRTGVE